MSTPSGDKETVAGFVAETKTLVAEAMAEEMRQDDLFQPTPEEMLEAREALGVEASHLNLVRHAREVRKRGRPPGSRNKSTAEFKKYILGFGQHPAITLMQIQATPPEILMQASKRKREQPYRDKDGNTIEYTESMSYADAQGLRIRCAAELLPYIESKQPVAVDMTFSGVADMFIEGVTHTRDEMLEAIDADFAPVDDPTLQPPGAGK